MRTVTTERLEKTADSVVLKAQQALKEVVDRRGGRNTTLAFHLFDQALGIYIRAYMQTDLTSTVLHDKAKACAGEMQGIDEAAFREKFPNGFMLITPQQAKEALEQPIKIKELARDKTLSYI